VRQSILTVAARGMRSLGVAAAYSRLTGAAPAVRVTTTHGVLSENYSRLADIVDMLNSRYRFVEPAAFFEFLDSDDPANHSANGGVLMTFDDGLMSSYEFALRQLSPRGIRALFFVPTAVFGMDRSEQHDFAIATRFPGSTCLRAEQFRTVDVFEVGKLIERGHVVMPHSHSHARLSELSGRLEYETEIEVPRSILEGLVPYPVNAFAFPYGTVSAISAPAYSWIARTYAYCFSAIGGLNKAGANPFLLRRDNLDQSFDVFRATEAVAGGLDAYHALANRRLRAIATPGLNHPA
jgi:peptidoglycan/xylan/chitin deacetylase (PgdA/CDA1 family)